MNLLKGRGIVRPSLILLFVFLALKGWVLLSMLGDKGDGNCLAEPAAAETPRPPPDHKVFETECDLRVGGLIRKVQEEETRLNQKANELDEKERRLQIFSREIEENINVLKKLRAQLQKIHQEIKTHENQQEKRLVKIYDAMEPDNAAQRLEAMDDTLGSWLLLRINVRKAGQILGALSPAKASRITAKLRGEDPRSAEQIEKALQSSRAKSAPKSAAVRASKAKPAKASRERSKDLSKERLLQIGTFSEPQRAERVVQALKSKGYPSFRKQWFRGEPRKAYYKVFVGPFPDRKQASATKARLEKREGYRGILVRTRAAAGA